MRVSTGEHPLLRAAQKRLDVLGGLGDVRDGAVLADHDAAVLYELELAWSAHTVHEAAAQHEPDAMVHSKCRVRRPPSRGKRQHGARGEVSWSPMRESGCIYPSFQHRPPPSVNATRQ